MTMKIKSPPRLVALDTQVFDSGNFNYTSSPFQGLIKLVQQEKIKILLTSITLDEIKAHITEGAALASDEIEKARKCLGKKHFNSQANTNKRIAICANSNSLYEFRKEIQNIAPNFEQIKQELLGQLEVFLTEIDVEMIEVDQVSVIEVFERYFSGSPPFGVGKKKSEFPDAFVLLALQQEAEHRNKIIYLVSGDSDWKNFCSSIENLSLFDKLDKLLEEIIRETDSDEVNVCYKLFNEKQDEIKEQIKDQFLTLDFSIDLFDNSLIEWESEEIEIEINSIDIIDSSLVSIDDFDEDQPSATFEVVAEVNYKAKATYESLEFATYDREDDKYFGGETTNRVFKKSIKLSSVEVTLGFFRDKEYSLCNPEIENVNIDPNNTLGQIVIDTGFYDDYY